MSILDIEENEVKDKAKICKLIMLGFHYNNFKRFARYDIRLRQARSQKHWAILFWDRGTEYKGKKLRSNRVMYRLPEKVDKSGHVHFSKKVVRNVTTTDFAIIMNMVHEYWKSFDEVLKAKKMNVEIIS